MKRCFSIVLLSIFTLCIVSISYGLYKKGNQTSVVMVEEDETHTQLLEVKEYLKTEDPQPFAIYKIIEFKTDQLTDIPVKNYEDVYLRCVETPPDFMC